MFFLVIDRFVLRENLRFTHIAFSLITPIPDDHFDVFDKALCRPIAVDIQKPVSVLGNRYHCLTN
jgi:hypothetical protein